MNSTKHEPEHTGEHIWLRYATQFTQGGRSYTVEMGVPVPVGASAEQREQLLREAEAGMGQLAQSVERRVSQMLHSPAAKPVAMPPTRPVTRTAPIPASPTSPQPAAPSPPPTSAPTPVTYAASATPPPANAATANRAQAETREREARRPTGGLSMPRMPAPGGDLPMPEFIAHLRENLGLNPKEAMAILKVKSLSGLNLRDALEQLEAMAAHTSTNAATAGTSANTVTVERDTSAMAKVLPVDSPPATPASQDEHERVSEPANVVRERGASLSRFDEEVGDEEASPEDDDLQDLPRELSASQRTRAKALLNRMREMRGAVLANAARLQVLRNVVEQQISNDDLLDLVKGVWHVPTQKKLKVDQTEFLISWAKEDDFVEEVEMILLLLEEE